LDRLPQPRGDKTQFAGLRRRNCDTRAAMNAGCKAAPAANIATNKQDPDGPESLLFPADGQWLAK